MKKEQQVISPRQFCFFLVIFLVGSGSLYVPEIPGGRDSWLSTILGAVVGLIPLFIVLHLNNKFSGLTIVQYSEVLLGKFLGKILSLIFIINVFILATLILEDLSVLFQVAVIPEAPDIFFRFSLVLLGIYAVFSGLESIGRLAELYFLPTIFLLFILPLATIPEMDMNHLRPALAEGFRPVIAGSIFALTFPFSEVSILALFLPMVERKKNLNLAILISYIVVLFLLIVRTITAISVFSAEVINKMQLPIYQVFKIVDLGNFLNRVEAIFIFIWIIGFFLNFVFSFYAAVLGFGQCFELKEKKFLVIPLGLILIYISHVMYPSTGHFIIFDFIGRTFFVLSVNILYPLLLFTISLFKEHQSQS